MTDARNAGPVFFDTNPMVVKTVELLGDDIKKKSWIKLSLSENDRNDAVEELWGEFLEDPKPGSNGDLLKRYYDEKNVDLLCQLSALRSACVEIDKQLADASKKKLEVSVQS